MAKKVHILADKVTNEKFALGISSNDSVFQIILELNKIASLDLKITKPATNPKKNERYSYPHGSSDLESETVLHIFNNKQNGQILFSGLNSFDYIFVFLGEDPGSLFMSIKDKLKQIPNITLTTKLEIKQLKNLKEILLSVE